MELEAIFEQEAFLQEQAMASNDSGSSSGDYKPGTQFITEAPLLAVPYLVISAITTILGSVGNIFIVGAVCVDKKLRTNGNVFIVNLAIADFCVTSFINPFNIIGILVGEQWFLDHAWVCELIACVCLTSCFCSLQSIAAISFNRYMHICHNSWYHRIYTLQSSIAMAITHWILCFLMELPNFLGWGGHAYDKKSLNCQFDRTASFSYTLFFNIAGVATPICLIAFCYFNVYLTVVKNKKKVASYNQKGGQSTEKAHSMRLARTLFIIFIVFVLCWSPFMLMTTVDFADRVRLEVYLFAVLSAHTNSSLNCIIYGATNQDFRKGYIKFLYCLLPLTYCEKIAKKKHSEMMTHFSLSNTRPGEPETKSMYIATVGDNKTIIEAGHKTSKTSSLCDETNSLKPPKQGNWVDNESNA